MLSARVCTVVPGVRFLLFLAFAGVVVLVFRSWWELVFNDFGKYGRASFRNVLLGIFLWLFQSANRINIESHLIECDPGKTPLSYRYYVLSDIIVEEEGF